MIMAAASYYQPFSNPLPAFANGWNSKHHTGLITRRSDSDSAQAQENVSPQYPAIHQSSHNFQPPSDQCANYSGEFCTSEHQAQSFNAPLHLQISTNHSIPEDIPPERLSRRRYLRWKRYLKTLKNNVECITTLINAIIFGIMLNLNISYYRSKNKKVGTNSFWPENAKVWPSIMVLVAALVTLFAAISTMIAYCVNFRKAGASWKVTIAKYVLSIAGWIVVSSIYKKEKGDNDLWGWSCSGKAEAVQKASNGKVDISRHCNIQVSSNHFPESLDL